MLIGCDGRRRPCGPNSKRRRAYRRFGRVCGARRRLTSCWRVLG